MGKSAGEGMWLFASVTGGRRHVTCDSMVVLLLQALPDCPCKNSISFKVNITYNYIIIPFGEF